MQCCTKHTLPCYYFPAELSEVLWNMALRRAVGVAFMYGIFMGALAVCGIFAFWASE